VYSNRTGKTSHTLHLLVAVLPVVNSALELGYTLPLLLAGQLKGIRTLYDISVQAAFDTITMQSSVPFQS
jgi:hypothetical protein